MKNNLRVLLAKKRQKVSDLAKGTGLSKSALTALYYERTKHPDIGTLKKVADYLNVSIDELLTVDDWGQQKKRLRSHQTYKPLNITTKTQHTGRQAILYRVLEHLYRYLNYTMNCWYRIPLLRALPLKNSSKKQGLTSN